MLLLLLLSRRYGRLGKPNADGELWTTARWIQADARMGTGA
jgi:hypothetical protein